MTITTATVRMIPLGMLMGVVVMLPLLGVAAVCTPLDDVTPAANTTYTVQSGECAGDITIAHDNVTVSFQPGAWPFQAGKSIVLPTTGVIVDLTLLFTGLNWTLSKKLFSGGHASNFELRGAQIEFKNSTIRSGVSDPVGLSAKLTTNSQYTVKSTNVSVTTSVSGSGVYLPGAISGGSAVTIHSSTVSVSGSGTCYGLRLASAFTDSRLTISGGSQLMATSSSHVANALYFNAPFTDSTLSITDGSALTAIGFSAAHALRFWAAVTDSTLSIADGSVVEATSSSSYAYGIYFLAAVSGSTVSMAHGAVVNATSKVNAYGIYTTASFTDSTLDIADGQLTAITSSGNSVHIAAAVYLHCDVSSTTNISISGSVLTGKSTTGSAKAYSLIKKIKTASNYQIGQITLRCSSFAGANDGEGPLDGTLKDNAAGKLAVSVTYWNNQTTPLNTSTMLQSYTSSTLSMETGNVSCPLAQQANEEGMAGRSSSSSSSGSSGSTDISASAPSSAGSSSSSSSTGSSSDASASSTSDRGSSSSGSSDVSVSSTSGRGSSAGQSSGGGGSSHTDPLVTSTPSPAPSRQASSSNPTTSGVLDAAEPERPTAAVTSAAPVDTTTAAPSTSSSSSSSALKIVEAEPELLNSATASVVSNVLGNKEAAVAIVGTGTASTAVASFASPAAASQAARVGMVAGVVQCAYAEDSVAPSLLEHPIQFHLIGSTVFSRLTGSIVATTLTFILLPMLLICLHFVASRHTEDNPLPKWRLGLQGKIFGTLLAIGLGYFAPSVVEGALVVLSHGDNMGQKFLAVLCILISLSPCVIGGFIFTRRFDDLVKVEPGKKPGKFDYKNFDDRLWAETLGPFIDATTNPKRLITRLYLVEEVGVTLLLAVVSGIRPTGDGGCAPLAGLMVGICSLHCLYLAIFRPYVAKLEMAFVALTAILLLAMSVIALVATLSDNPSAGLMKALGYVALVESIIFFAQAAVLGFWAYTVSERRKVKEREAAAALAVGGGTTTVVPVAPSSSGATAPAVTNNNNTSNSQPLLSRPVAMDDVVDPYRGSTGSRPAVSGGKTILNPLLRQRK